MIYYAIAIANLCSTGLEAVIQAKAKLNETWCLRKTGYREGTMEIIPGKITDRDILELFSEHDTFMLDVLGEDRIYYTRYNGNEKLERVWTACFEGLPVGCIAYRTKEAGTGEVKRLFVRPAYRGRGLSKELLLAVERYAREQGCRRLYLDTRITLEPAVSLYRGFGFQITFQQGQYIQMEKELRLSGSNSALSDLLGPQRPEGT